MHLLPPLLALLALAVPARAQFVVLELPGAAAGDLFGNALAGGLDVDGDGRPDLVIGARRSNAGALNGGRVEVRSGSDGSLILAVDAPGVGDSLGHAVGLIGDVNGDGRPDFVLGAPLDDSQAWNGGLARVISGAAGSTLRSHAGVEQFGLLGWSVAGLGDVDGDGLPDYVIGAPEEDGAGADSGAVYVRSGATGALLQAHVGPGPRVRLGRSVAGAGDANGDGRADVLAGADLEDVGPLEGAGVVRLWSGLDGSLLALKQGGEAQGRLGFAVAGVGDVDGDGRDDFAAGAFGEGPAGFESGRAYVWSGASGALLHVFEGAQAGDQLGWSVAGAGDVDGDGVPDILVGAPGEAGGRGAVRVYSGAGGVLLFVTHGESPGERLGEAVATAGDLDGDGRAEWAAGAPFAPSGGASSGRVLVLSSRDPAGQPFCAGDGGGGFCPCANFGATGEGCENSTGRGARLAGQGLPSVAADQLELHLEGLPLQQPALLFAGLNPVNGGLGQPFGDGLLCVAGGIVRLPIRFADPFGRAAWGPGLFATYGWQPGDLRRLQAWYRDPLNPFCGTGFNLSNGFELSPLP